MYSMIATAPESIQQRRRLQSSEFEHSAIGSSGFNSPCSKLNTKRPLQERMQRQQQEPQSSHLLAIRHDRQHSHGSSDTNNISLNLDLMHPTPLLSLDLYEKHNPLSWEKDHEAVDHTIEIKEMCQHSNLESSLTSTDMKDHNHTLIPHLLTSGSNLTLSDNTNHFSTVLLHDEHEMDHTSTLHSEAGNSCKRTFQRCCSKTPMFDREFKDCMTEESTVGIVNSVSIVRTQDDINTVIHENMSHRDSSLFIGSDEIDALDRRNSMSFDSNSEIGGDTYFDRTPNNHDTDNIINHTTNNDPVSTESKTDQLYPSVEQISPISPPPKLTRLTTYPYSDDKCADVRHYSSSPERTTRYHMMESSRSPSPNHPFTHTHSLLDDCSDEEDEISSYALVDSPTRSYSCFPKRHSGNGKATYSFFRKQKHNRRRAHSTNNIKSNSSSSTNQVTSNIIQHAMLQTRHRRWICQSAFAGAHAQSCQIFNLTHRVHYVPISNIAQIQNYTRKNVLIYESKEEKDKMIQSSNFKYDEAVTFLARMSLSCAAIRAGALASGIWRTVQLVQLPKGLFERDWLLWNSNGQQAMSKFIDDDDVWLMLEMLRETFPMMQQIDFGGDIGNSSEDNFSRDEFSNASSIRNIWREDVQSRIIQLLPQLVFIDGARVVSRCSPVETQNQNDVAPSPTEYEKEAELLNLFDIQGACPDDLYLNDIRSGKYNSEEIQSSVACAVCEPVNMRMCGWSHLVDTQTEGIQYLESDTSNNLQDQSSAGENLASFSAPEQCSVAGDVSISAIEDVSMNLLSMIGNFVVHDVHSEDKTSCTNHCQLPKSGSQEEQDNSHDDLQASFSSSLLLSSSWGSASSGTRPPKCPTSNITRTNLEKKLFVGRKKSKGSMLKISLKQRLLGSIPKVSVMDADEEDSDENENVDSEECHTDLL